MTVAHINELALQFVKSN